MVFKFSEKVNILQFCADVSSKSNSSKAIYIYSSKRSCYAVSEKSIIYYAMLTVMEMLSFEIEDFY